MSSLSPGSSAHSTSAGSSSRLKPAVPSSEDVHETNHSTHARVGVRPTVGSSSTSTNSVSPWQVSDAPTIRRTIITELWGWEVFRSVCLLESVPVSLIPVALILYYKTGSEPLQLLGRCWIDNQACNLGVERFLAVLKNIHSTLQQS